MNRRHRRLWLSLVGVVVAAAVGFGVVAAVARSGLEERERLARAWRAVDVVHGVVEESLEELRLRESARPFDHYNAVYVPEGVLAASDALAPSPLSRAPDDPRLRGWVQLNPDGTVTLPFDATRPELAALVRAEVAGDGFAPLRALTAPPTGPVLAQASPPRASGSSPKATRSRASSSLGSLVEPAPPAAPTEPDSGLAAKQGLLQQLNVASTNVYSQLKEAAPEPSKRAAIAQNEPLPKIARTDVDWSDEELGKLGTKAKAPSKKKPAMAQKKNLANLKAEGEGDGDPTPSMAQQAAPTPTPTPTPPDTTSNAPTPAPTVAVSYTPMVFDEIGGQRVLHRTVTSLADGARTVQLALLDEAAMRSWLEGILARRVDAAIAGRLIAADADDDRCAVRAPVSTVLDDIDLCVPASARGTGVGLEVGVLLALLLLVIMVLVVLDRAAERAEALARQRSAFVSAVSHELRTPLTTLRMYAELLRDGLVSDPEKARRFHGDMVQESVRLSHLVENVLEAQRLEEGRRPLRLEELDLGGLVRSVVDGQRPLLTQRGFQVDVDIADGDLVGAVDRQAIEQTLVNLIENAVKYGRGDDAHLQVAVARRGDHAVISVADRGPGIPRHERERVFQRFARMERPGEEHVAGTGLGLALVRELARAWGGDARIVDSAVGCRVEVTVPWRSLAT